MQNESVICHQGRWEILLQAGAHKGTLSWLWVHYGKFWWKALTIISLRDTSSASILCSCLGKPECLRIIKRYENLIYYPTITLPQMTNNESFSDNINRSVSQLSSFSKGCLKLFKQDSSCFSFMFFHRGKLFKTCTCSWLKQGKRKEYLDSDPDIFLALKIKLDWCVSFHTGFDHYWLFWYIRKMS